VVQNCFSLCGWLDYPVADPANGIWGGGGATKPWMAGTHLYNYHTKYCYDFEIKIGGHRGGQPFI